MAKTYKIFIGGGGDNWFSHIVERYAERYRKSNPAYECPYYGWAADIAINRILTSAPEGSDITIIGHSYGADTAFSAIQNGHSVRTLITIDPVGRIRPSWTAIRARCFIWLNVRAEPSAASRSFDDTVAGVGGKYPRPPSSGQPGAPNYSIIADKTHGAFDDMMRVTNNQGVSGRSLLGGNSDA